MRRFLAALAIGSVTLGAVTAQPPASKKRALLVGVSTYSRTGLADKPLRFAAPDMEKLAGELKSAGWDVTLRISKGTTNDASRAKILAAFEELLKDVSADDLVLFAFSGHGQQFRAFVETDDNTQQQQEEAFICPSDAVTGDAESLIGLTKILRRMGKNGGRNLVLIDACRDDPRRGGKGVDGNTARFVPNNTAVLFSCAARQQSFETNQMFNKNSTEGHGVFFYRIWLGLSGNAANDKGEVTWGGLVEYVTSSVNDDAVRWFPERVEVTARGEKVVQTPHMVGSLVGKSPLLAKRIRLQSTENTTAEAEHEEGTRLMTYRTEDESRALEYFLRAAKKGHVKSQRQLGYMYLNGRGTKADPAESTKWFGLAAVAGDAESQAEYGKAIFAGLGVPANESAGAEWMAKSAAQGHARALNDLGWMHENGRGVAEDHRKAVELFRQAAEKDWANGQYNHGRMLEFGKGVDKNEQEAAKWYRLAARQGNVWALDALGDMHWEGRGVSQDYEEAFRCYQAAARVGHARSQANLGYMYGFGLGVNKDLNEAVSWYRKAADQGDARGQMRLASMYLDGHGVEKDVNEAVRLYRLAAKQGEQAALEQLKKLGYEP